VKYRVADLAKTQVRRETGELKARDGCTYACVMVMHISENELSTDDFETSGILK
jgi:hypothetical protein